MSATELRKSVVDSTNSPKDESSSSSTTTFSKASTLQYLFFEGLIVHTPTAYAVYPGMARVFSENSGQSASNKGKMSFYLHGSGKRAIDLLVNGGKVGDYTAPVNPGEKCAGLPLDDYVVVAFRVNRLEKIRAIFGVKNQITVCFTWADYSVCKCTFGLGKPIHIHLKE